MSTPTPSTPTPSVSPWLLISRPHRGWAFILGTLAGIALGAVFLVAAWAKAIDPTAFVAEIERQGLDFLLPAEAVALVALALEVFLGSALVLGLRRRFVLWPTAALVVFFLFLTGRTWWQDVQGTLPDDGAGCGCFGNLVERTPAEAFWQDLLLMLPALLVAFAGRSQELAWKAPKPWPRRRLGVVGTLAAATVLLAWKAPELPLDDLATRLKPGVQALELCTGGDGSPVCLETIVPEIALDEHLVVLADVTDPAFRERIGWLNDYHFAASEPSAAGTMPTLWILTSASEEELFELRFGFGPAFELRETPAALLRPLYRTLPRSFLTRDGEVVETYSDWPPLDRWGAP